MRATGSQSSIKFVQEKTWKEVVIKANMAEVYGLNVRSCNLGGKKGQFQSETINQYRAIVGLGDGNKVVDGNIVTDFLPEGLEVPLRHLLGKGTIATSGTGPYTHTLKGSADSMQGLMIQKAFTNVDEYFIYTGNRINSMAINIIQEGFHDVTWDMIGSTETISATDQMLVNADDDPPVYPTKSGFTGYDCVVSTDHATPGTFVAISNVTDGNINISNSVETDGYVLGSDERASAELGMRECSGAFKMFFSDSTLYALFNSGIECGLRFTFDNETDSITFEFPKVKIQGDSPAIESASGVNLNLTFKARYDTTTSTDVTVTIVNSTATIDEEPT